MTEDNVIDLPKSDHVTPKELLTTALEDVDEIENLVIIFERKDGEFDMGHTCMPRRDLWWMLSNTTTRIWHTIEGV